MVQRMIHRHPRRAQSNQLPLIREKLETEPYDVDQRADRDVALEEAREEHGFYYVGVCGDEVELGVFEQVVQFLLGQSAAFPKQFLSALLVTLV
jgi:hypothetical protein